MVKIKRFSSRIETLTDIKFVVINRPAGITIWLDQDKSKNVRQYCK